MSSVTFDDSAKDIVKKIRDTNSDSNWLLLGFDGESLDRIIAISSGDGGASELAQQLQSDKVLYGLVRVKETIDQSSTIKFCFIQYIGENVKPMKKARTSTQIGKIQEFLTPYHTDILTSSAEDVSEAIVTNKIAAGSGQKSHVREEGTHELKVKKVEVSAKRSNLVPMESGSNLKFSDQSVLIDGIRDVRSDDTPTNWALAGFADGSADTLVLLGKGTGGVNELKVLLKDDEVQYGLVRLTDKIDNSTTTKFIFVHWVGEQVKYTRKARIGIHIGKITDLFTPHHTDLTIVKLDDISEEIVNKKIRNMRDAKVSEVAEKVKTSVIAAKRKSLVPTGALHSVVVSNEGEFKDAVRTLRDSSSNVNWVLISYETGNTNILNYVGSGSGGAEELKNSLKNDGISYGLVRIFDQIDNSKTIKYCFINWVGEEVKSVVRARVATNTGFVTSLLAPYHVDVHVSNLGELSMDGITNKVRETSGSKTKVLEKQHE